MFVTDRLTDTALVVANGDSSMIGAYYFSIEGRWVIGPTEDDGIFFATNGFPVDIYIGGYQLSGPGP